MGLYHSKKDLDPVTSYKTVNEEATKPIYIHSYDDYSVLSARVASAIFSPLLQHICFVDLFPHSSKLRCLLRQESLHESCANVMRHGIEVFAYVGNITSEILCCCPALMTCLRQSFFLLGPSVTYAQLGYNPH